MKSWVSRRDVLRLLAAPALFELGAPGRLDAADHLEAILPDNPDPHPPARRTWLSPPDCYFTYPHCNGFLPNGNPVLGQLSGSDKRNLTCLEWDFQTGETRSLYNTYWVNRYWEVAERSGELIAMRDRRRIVAVSTVGRPRIDVLAEFNSTPAARIEDLVSVNSAADKVIYAVEQSNNNDFRNIAAAQLLEIDRHSGKSTVLGDIPFDADHPHYCPADESWIGFSHEGDISKSLDRIWALNRAVNGGNPQRMWDEVLPDSGVAYVGHERWAFHKTGCFAVAYPVSPGHPRGLYFVDAATRRGSLVSASDYDWHCNVSRDGVWAVVDTMRPPHRRTESDGRNISDIVLIHVPTGRRRWLARSHMDRDHPWHPHPHFSPDGKFVIYNDYQHDGAGQASRTVIVEVELKA